MHVDTSEFCKISVKNVDLRVREVRDNRKRVEPVLITTEPSAWLWDGWNVALGGDLPETRTLLAVTRATGMAGSELNSSSLRTRPKYQLTWISSR